MQLLPNWWAGGNALNLSAADSYNVCHLVCIFKCNAQELKQFFIVCNSQFLTVLKTKQLMHREKDTPHFHPFLHWNSVVQENCIAVTAEHTFI